MSGELKVMVSARALHQVLGALVGPSHYLRELQATRNLPLGEPNPINTLIDQYNAAIKASRTSPAVQHLPSDDTEGGGL